MTRAWRNMMVDTKKLELCRGGSNRGARRPSQPTCDMTNVNTDTLSLMPTTFAVRVRVPPSTADLRQEHPSYGTPLARGEAMRR